MCARAAVRRFGFPLRSQERPPLPFFCRRCVEEHLANDGGADEVQPSWTQEMDGFLRRSHARGKTMGWIARALGRPREACVARAVALGLVKPRRAQAFAAPPPEPKPIGAMNDVLDEGVCHWVAGCVAARVWRMCGHPSVHGTLWCAHHLARVRQGAGRRDG
jgi:hypothetical protein